MSSSFPDFKYFYYNKILKFYRWQSAPYIEDGRYIDSKDMKTFTLWEIPSFGGEPSNLITSENFLELLDYNENNPNT